MEVLAIFFCLVFLYQFYSVVLTSNLIFKLHFWPILHLSVFGTSTRMSLIHSYLLWVLITFHLDLTSSNWDCCILSSNYKHLSSHKSLPLIQPKFLHSICLPSMVYLLAKAPGVPDPILHLFFQIKMNILLNLLPTSSPQPLRSFSSSKSFLNEKIWTLQNYKLYLGMLNLSS